MVHSCLMVIVLDLAMGGGVIVVSDCYSLTCHSDASTISDFVPTSSASYIGEKNAEIDKTYQDFKQSVEFLDGLQASIEVPIVDNRAVANGAGLYFASGTEFWIADHSSILITIPQLCWPVWRSCLHQG